MFKVYYIMYLSIYLTIYLVVLCVCLLMDLGEQFCYPFFLNLDFSLKNWYKDIGASINSTLSKLSAAKLLEELGISKYTQDPQCQRSGPVYSPHVNGWKSGNLSFTLYLIVVLSSITVETVQQMFKYDWM